MWFRRKARPFIGPSMTGAQLAEVLERFVDGTLYKWGWDDPPEATRKILEHLGLPTRPPPLAPADPDLRELDLTDM